MYKQALSPCGCRDRVGPGHKEAPGVRKGGPGCAGRGPLRCQVGPREDTGRDDPGFRVAARRRRPGCAAVRTRGLKRASPVACALRARLPTPGLRVPLPGTPTPGRQTQGGAAASPSTPLHSAHAAPKDWGRVTDGVGPQDHPRRPDSGPPRHVCGRDSGRSAARQRVKSGLGFLASRAPGSPPCWPHGPGPGRHSETSLWL